MIAPLRTRIQSGSVLLIALALLGGCVRLIPQASGPSSVPRPPVTRPAPAPVPLPTPSAPLKTARDLALAAGPAVASLPITPLDATRALASFRESCPRLQALRDSSGLTTAADWQPICAAAAAVQPGAERAFFAERFETARIGEGTSFVTGYYEPEIAGVRVRQPGFDVPVYALPPDLVRQSAEDMATTDTTSGKPPLGRYDSTGAFRPYYTRAEIEDGALAGRGLELAWAADPAEFFFLQVQGSGRLRAPDGTVMRIGFGGQNGHPYTAIGGILRKQGLLGEGPGQYPQSMQGIVRYLHEHPAEGRELMRQDASYIFFRELKGDGPVGALSVPVRARASLAADPRFVPLGAPVWLALDRAEASGLWVAQDTGGAIKGANRFDAFWGAGEEARRIAGGLAARGTALVLLPRGTVARLLASPSAQP